METLVNHFVLHFHEMSTSPPACARIVWAGCTLDISTMSSATWRLCLDSPKLSLCFLSGYPE